MPVSKLGLPEQGGEGCSGDGKPRASWAFLGHLEEFRNGTLEQQPLLCLWAF